MSCLGMAVFGGDNNAVESLLEMGAPAKYDILFNGSVYSPLWHAITTERKDILETLLVAGYDPNETQNGETPIAYCSRVGLADMTILLCRHGPVLDLKDDNSLLYYWVRRGDVDYVDQYGGYDSQYLDVIRELLIHGAPLSDSKKEVSYARDKWLKQKESNDTTQMAEAILSGLENKALGGDIKLQNIVLGRAL